MASEAFQIETNIPLPEGRQTHSSAVVSALRALLASKSGASVFIPQMRSAAISNIARSYGLGSMKAIGLTARAVDGGSRVWKR
jgi:hypothetical protein